MKKVSDCIYEFKKTFLDNSISNHQAERINYDFDEVIYYRSTSYAFFTILCSIIIWASYKNYLFFSLSFTDIEMLLIKNQWKKIFDFILPLTVGCAFSILMLFCLYTFMVRLFLRKIVVGLNSNVFYLHKVGLIPWKKLGKIEIKTTQCQCWLSCANLLFDQTLTIYTSSFAKPNHFIIFRRNINHSFMLEKMSHYCPFPLKIVRKNIVKKCNHRYLGYRMR